MTATRGTGSSRIETLDRVRSPQRHNERPIYVYLPPSYDVTDTRYPVLYMHDGQNLFDAALSFAGKWGVDESIDRLSREGIEAIAVGIPNLGPERFDEYSPFPDPTHGGGDGDSYLAFVVETIKPMIDARFRTNPTRARTGIVGSSMGGLISLYAFFARRQTFGFAGAMSPSLWYGRRRIFQVLDQTSQVDGKLYLDVGTAEGRATLADARRMRDVLKQKVSRADVNFKYVEDKGGKHSEAAWSRRLEGMLRFLLASEIK